MNKHWANELTQCVHCLPLSKGIDDEQLAAIPLVAGVLGLVEVPVLVIHVAQELVKVWVESEAGWGRIATVCMNGWKHFAFFLDMKTHT